MVLKPTSISLHDIVIQNFFGVSIPCWSVLDTGQSKLPMPMCATGSNNAIVPYDPVVASINSRKVVSARRRLPYVISPSFVPAYVKRMLYAYERSQEEMHTSNVDKWYNTRVILRRYNLIPPANYKRTRKMSVEERKEQVRIYQREYRAKRRCTRT